jgi:uncharacterized metal-binding protein YceD (DUF177 family)
MSLKINLRHLEETELRRKGEAAPGEMDWGVQDEALSVDGPLQYDLTVQKLEDALLVQGVLRIRLRCNCVRCLKAFSLPLELSAWTRHLPLQGEECVPVVNDCVDLTPYLREDILLEFPQHPLCEADCRGMPNEYRGIADRADGASQTKEQSTAWSQLDKLKF